MATVAPLDAFQEVSLPQGTVRYFDQGTGPTLVFIHGLLANGWVLSRVIPRLVSQFGCIAPQLPSRPHPRPLHPDVELSRHSVELLVTHVWHGCVTDGVT